MCLGHHGRGVVSVAFTSKPLECLTDSGCFTPLSSVASGVLTHYLGAQITTGVAGLLGLTPQKGGAKASKDERIM